MNFRVILWSFLAASLFVTGCQQFELEAGFKQPAELTATAQAQPPMSSPTPKPQLGKLAFVRGGDIWVKELPDGEEKRLTQDGRNSEPRWSASGEWLAYHKNNQVWVTRADGTGLRLVHGWAPAELFAWSPVEDRLAFIIRGGLTVELADGSEQKEIVQEPKVPRGGSPLGKGVNAIAWSPDGQWIAFEKLDNTGPSLQGLWRVKADGSELKEVYLNPNPVLTQSHLATWTPDGQSLLYWQGRQLSSSLLADGVPLMQVPVDGGAPITFTEKSVLHHGDFISWSPDGEKLALVSGGGRSTWENKAIAIATAANNFRSISASGSADLFPSWSPDGRRIAFVSGPASPGNRGGEDARQPLNQRRIWIQEADGSAKRQLTNDSGFRDERPLWSSDGSYILFTRFHGEQAQVWLMRADGSEQRRVVDELTPSPNWFSDFGYVDWNQYFDWWMVSGRRSAPPTSAFLPATPSAAPTAVSTPLPAVAPPPVLIREGSALTAAGLYIADTTNGKLWQADSQDWSPDGKTLARSSGGLDLLDMEVGSAIRIVDGMVDASAWSPDGKQLAFYRPEERLSGIADSVGLYTVNKDGSGLKKHSLLPRINAISWSPDGSHLSFRIGGEGVFLLDLGIGEVSEITRSRSMSSAWLENGRSMLLGGETGLYLYNLESKDRRQISSERVASFALSPDGSKVIISSGTGYYRPNARLLVVNLEDGSVVKPPLELEVASWSPDGKQIAYLNNGCQGKGGDWDIYTTPIDGSSIRRLTDFPGDFKEGVSWSPTGTSIAFTMGGKVILVDANTGDLRTLASSASEYFHMHGSPWSPDGRYVVFGTGGHGYCD